MTRAQLADLPLPVWRLLIVGAIVALALLRLATGGEYAFTTAVLLPLLLAAWIEGLAAGLAVAALAAAAWLVGDLSLAGDGKGAAWANGLTRLLVYAAVVAAVAGIRQQHLQARREARIDPLTGLLNRRGLLEEGEREWRRSIRYGHNLSVAFIDLDSFKALNDRHGHEAGDAALRSVARALEAHIRASDRAARWGGDEFVVLLPETGLHAAREAAGNLKYTLDSALSSFDPVTASVGFACLEEHAESFAALIQAADVQMYRAKPDRSRTTSQETSDQRQ